MAPQLQVLGKKLLMEHFLSKNQDRKSKCFLRSLFINKSFLNIANNRRIYKILVLLEDEKKIRLMFKSYTELFYRSCSYYMFESACCVFKLLKPSFTSFYYGYIYDEKRLGADSLLTLMQLARVNGKVILNMDEFGDGDVFFNVLKHVYEYVDELECRVGLLEQISTIQFKLLDKLTANWIDSNEQLNIALKHPAKQLDLEFSENFEHNLDVGLVQLHKNDAKQCTLCFGRLNNANQLYPITQNVLNAVDQLETLDIEYKSRFEDMSTFAMLLNEISQLYQMFVMLVELIRQSYPTLNINFDLGQYCAKIKIKLPEDWQKQVKQIGGLQNAVIEEKLDESQQYLKRITLQVKIDLTNAKFVIYGYDLYRDQEETEINGDDVSHGEEME